MSFWLRSLVGLLLVWLASTAVISGVFRAPAATHTSRTPSLARWSNVVWARAEFMAAAVSGALQPGKLR